MLIMKTENDLHIFVFVGEAIIHPFEEYLAHAFSWKIRLNLIILRFKYLANTLGEAWSLLELEIILFTSLFLSLSLISAVDYSEWTMNPKIVFLSFFTLLCATSCYIAYYSQ